MSDKAVLIEKENGVAIVSINQTKTMNSLTQVVIDGLQAAAEELVDDPETRVIILTGEGNAFCAGGDLNRFTEGFDGYISTVDYVDSIHPTIKAWAAMKKPVIAAVNGACVGAGLSLMSLCDMAYMSEDAKVGCAFINMALAPDCGLAYYLPRTIGAKKAMEMVLTGKNYTAEEAEKMGLINGIFSSEELMPEVKKIAARLAKGPADALRLAKRMVNLGLDMDLNSLLNVEALIQASLLISDDSNEAVSAFLEKRKPVFKGC